MRAGPTAGGAAESLLSRSLSPSFFPPRARLPLTYLFLSPSLAPFLPRLLLLYFCPFARFLLPQTTAAYLYPVFASRRTERGCFCVYSSYCRVVVVCCRIAVTAYSALSFDPLFPSSLNAVLQCARNLDYVTRVVSLIIFSWRLNSFINY